MSDVMIAILCFGVLFPCVIFCVIFFANKYVKEENEYEELSKFKRLALTKNGELFELTNPFVDKQYNEAGCFGIQYDFHKRKNYYVKSKKSLERTIRESDIIKRFDNLIDAQKYMQTQNK